MKISSKISGFTIVELVVVIAILGILVGLTTFGYRGWQDGLDKRVIHSDLTMLMSAMESVKNFSDGYPTSLPSTFKASDELTVAYIGGDLTRFCIQAQSTRNTSLIYHIDTALGKEPRVGSCDSAYALSAPTPTTSSIKTASMTVTWPAVTGATSYEVSYGPTTPSSKASCTNSPCILGGLSPSTNYKLTVKATGPYGSTTSAIVTATTSAFDVAEIALSAESSCAITVSREAFCWGSGGNGKLGNGTNDDKSRPTLVAPSGTMSGKSVSRISLSNFHGCALADSNVYCWGSNSYSTFSNGSNTGGGNIPVSAFTSGIHTGVGGPISTVEVGTMRTCIMKQGWVYCSGYNQWGDIGDGSTATIRASSVEISRASFPAGTSINSIAVSPESGSNCAITNAVLYCWGKNNDGQVGDGSITNRPSPVAITGGSLAGKSVTRVQTTNIFTCSVANGTAHCWGRNPYGNLGDGTPTNRTSPTPVSVSGVLAGKTVTEVATGANHACALASGAVYCWGANYGKLGDGTTTPYSYTPVAVKTTGALSGKTVTAIAAGTSHTCALASGEVFCWGFNSSNQVGDGGNTTVSEPVKVLSP